MGLTINSDVGKCPEEAGNIPLQNVRCLNLWGSVQHEQCTLLNLALVMRTYELP